MAARKATSRRKGSTVDAESSYEGSSTSGSSRGGRSGSSEFADMGQIRQWLTNPAVRYVAGGIASAVLAKLATNISEKYPSLSNFIREGMDAVEGKLAEFNDMSGSGMSSAGGATRSRRGTAGLNTH